MLMVFGVIVCLDGVAVRVAVLVVCTEFVGLCSGFVVWFGWLCVGCLVSVWSLLGCLLDVCWLFVDCWLALGRLLLVGCCLSRVGWWLVGFIVFDAVIACVAVIIIIMKLLLLLLLLSLLLLLVLRPLLLAALPRILVVAAGCRC